MRFLQYSFVALFLLNPDVVLAGNCKWALRSSTSGHLLEGVRGTGGNTENVYLGCAEKDKGNACGIGNIVEYSGGLKQCAKVSETIKGKSIQYIQWQDYTPSKKLTNCTKDYSNDSIYKSISIDGKTVILQKGNGVAMQEICLVSKNSGKKTLANKDVQASEPTSEKTINISGAVVNQDNSPINGATVAVGNQNVKTGANGQFAIASVAEDSNVSISFDGCNTQKIKAGFLQKNPQVRLTCTAQSPEVVVTATKCGAVGQKECKDNAAYYVCEKDTDCIPGKTLPKNATAGHCVSAERKDYKICTATLCDKDFTPTQGYCKQNKNNEAKSSDKTPDNDPVKLCKDETWRNSNCKYGSIKKTWYCPFNFDELDSTKMSEVMSAECMGFFGNKDCAVEKTNDEQYKRFCFNDGQVLVLGVACDETDENIAVETYKNLVGTGKVTLELWNTDANGFRCIKAENTNPEGTEVEPVECDAENGETLDTSTNTCVPAAQNQGQSGQPEAQATDPEAEKRQEIENNLKNAQEELDKAQANEQSFANRMLGGASMAATGLGAMQAASAYAEQQADAAAEQQMRAYLATMKCEYGDGQNVVAGAEEVTLPGGNELLEYYTEYKSLADSLKQTKTALGLRSGIESEILYDRAQSGLYQYASTGKTGGAYTSLSRALTDSDGADAAAWATQKDESSKKLKTGAIVAGAGVVAGVAGNILINGSDSYTSGFDSIKSRFSGWIEKLKEKNKSDNVSEQYTDEAGEHSVVMDSKKQVSASTTTELKFLFKSADSTTFDGDARDILNNDGKLVNTMDGEKTMAAEASHVIDYLKMDTTGAKVQCITIDSRPTRFADMMKTYYADKISAELPNIKVDFKLNKSYLRGCAANASVCDNVVTSVYNRPCGK